MGECRERGIASVGQYRVSERPECSRDRGLEPWLDRQVLSNEPSNAGKSGSDECARAVLLVNRERERRIACGERISLPLGGVQLLPKGLDLRLHARHERLRAFVHRREFAIAIARDTGVLFDAAELCSGRITSLFGLVERVLLPQRLATCTLDARRRKVDARGKTRKLEFVARNERTLSADLLVERVKRCLGCCRRSGSSPDGFLRLGHSGREPLRLVASLLYGGRGDGHSSAGTLGLLTKQTEALVRERVEAAKSLLYRLKAEGSSAGDVDGIPELGLLEASLPKLGLVELFLKHDPLGLALRLAAAHSGDRGAQLNDLVCEESSASIPNDRSNRHGLFRDLGLRAQRLELASNFTGEVGKSRQVGLHGVELAEGFLLATAVLEDACRLLDKAPAVVSARVQHRVELALPDDDMHLAAEARIAQQFLHIEQSTLLTIDGVLAPPVAEQGATDGHLGVLDRQGTV